VARRFIVVSTQGKGDEAALRDGCRDRCFVHAFVGSRRNMTALKRWLSINLTP
jgi:xanthine dehydrogenase accessory factor